MGYTKNITIEENLKYRSRMSIPEFTTTTLNGTLYLTNTSAETQFLTGTATGFTIYLPNATSLPVTNKGGWIFNIYNMSSSTVDVKNAAGTLQFTMSQTSASPFLLQDNTNAAGIWVGWQVFANSSAGLLNYTIESSTPFPTSSLTFVPITGFNISNAVTGLYVLLYNASCSGTQNNAVVQTVLYIGGVQLADSLRKVQTVSANFVFQTSLVTVHPVIVGQTVDIRVSIDQGTLNVLDRTLVMLRIGNIT